MDMARRRLRWPSSVLVVAIALLGVGLVLMVLGASTRHEFAHPVRADATVIALRPGYVRNNNIRYLVTRPEVRYSDRNGASHVVWLPGVRGVEPYVGEHKSVEYDADNPGVVRDSDDRYGATIYYYGGLVTVLAGAALLAIGLIGGLRGGFLY